MIKFRNILHFPSKYKDRNKNVAPVKILISNLEKIDNKLVITGETDKYVSVIAINDIDKFDINNEVQINCNCESFKYEFQTPVYNSGGLYHTRLINTSHLTVLPKEKNQFMVVSGCKHIIKLAQIILSNTDRIINRINGSLNKTNGTEKRNN